MDRAVIFRYDGARRRVRAAGAYGIDLDTFADAQVTVETVQVARESLVEDRVIEISSAMAEGVPDEYRTLIRESTLVCTPMAAAGRWLGVILSDRRPDRPPLSDSERYLLWTLGKTAALAAFARLATNKQAQARQLQERMDLAREVHESVIQRLFGIQLVFSSQAELSPAARERIGAELQAALSTCGARSSARSAAPRRRPHTTLLEEVERLRKEHRDLHLTLRAGSERVHDPARARAARPVGARRGGPQRPQARRADQGRGQPRDQGRRHARARRRQRRRAQQGRARTAWASSSRRSRRSSSAGSSSSASASRANGESDWRCRLTGPDLNPAGSPPARPTASCACWSSTTTRSCTGACG